MKRKFETVQNGLNGMTETFKSLSLEMPELEEGLLEDPNRFDEAVQKKSEAVHQIQEKMEHSLNWLKTSQDWIERQENETKKEIAQDFLRDKIAKVRDFIESCLSSGEPFYKAAAVSSYLRHSFSLSFEDRENAVAMVSDIEERGFLVKDIKGPIHIGYQRYRLGDFGLISENAKKVEEAISEFSRRFHQLVYQDRMERTESASLEADISLDQFKEGVSGKCLLGIPPESYISQGKECWRGGGSIFLENKGKNVFPLFGIGSLEKAVEGIRSMGVQVPHYTLFWKTPPGHGKAFNRVKAGVIQSLGLSSSEAEVYVKKMQAFWHMIRRGLEAADHQEEMESLKEEWRGKASITPEDFYNNREGTALLEFNGGFKQKSKPAIYNLFFLVRKKKEDGKNAVEIIDFPEHLQEFLGVYVGRKYMEGNNFKGLPADLGRVFRGIRGQVDMAAEVS